MSKPVEIEFLMKDGLTPDLNKAGKSFTSLRSQAQAEMKKLTSLISEQKAGVRGLEGEVKRLQKAYSQAKDFKAQNEIAEQLETTKYKLKEANEALDDFVERKDALGNALDQMGSGLKTRLREMTQAIAELRVEYGQMSEAERNSATGQQLKAHIEELTEQAGVLRDAIGDTNDAIKNAASDTRNFDQMAGVLRLVVDGFGLATGAAQLFGMSEEELAEAQTKLQAIMVTSNALTSAQTQLQQQSAVMQGIHILQTKAAATAESIKTAAQGKGIVVTKLATVAQAAFNAVARANPYVLLAGAVISVVGALLAFSKGSAAAKKAEEERKAQMEEMQRKQEEFRQAVVDAAGDQVASFLKMKATWESFGDSFDKKKKFLADTKDEWAKLGLEVKNVNDMEEIFRNHTGDMLNAIILRAQIKAYDKKIQEVADEMVDAIHRPYEYNAEWVQAGSGFGDLSSEELNAIRGHYREDTSPYDHTQVFYFLDDEARRIIAEMRKPARVEEIKAKAQNQIAGFVKEVKDLQEQLDQVMGTIPGSPTGNNNPTTDPKKDPRAEAERRVAAELQKLRWQNRQKEIDQMEEGSEKRRKQIELDYDKEIAAIREMEQRWTEANGGLLSEEQSQAISSAYTLAMQKADKALEEMSAEEVAKNREKLNALLEQYRDYDQRRRDIDAAYTADMDVLNAELARLQQEGGDTSRVESSIHARTEAYKKEIQGLQSEILQSTTFYDKLFSDTSEKGYKVLRDFYKQAQEVLASAKMGADGVEITVTDKDKDGNFVKKTVKVTIEEYEKLKKKVESIRKDLEKRNPFTAFKNSWKELTDAMKNDGDVTGALTKLNSKGKEVTSTIRGWGDSLGAVFGDRFSKSMNEIMDFCDGAMNMGTGIAQIWSGDIVGGITNTLSGLSSIISLFSGWKEKMEEMRRQWYLAEIETQRALREQAESYAASQSKVSDIIKDTETLNWLIEKGFAKPNSVSVWEAQSEAFAQYQKDLKAEEKTYDQLWSKLQGSTGYYEWGNSLNGGSMEWSLRGYSAEQIQLWYNQDKLSSAARDYYEAWVDSGKAVEDLVANIEECYQAMQEMVMGVSFDSFLSNAKDVLKEMRSDIGALGEFTEETLANAILNAFMYKELAKMLEPLYDELSENLINGTADENYLENWRRRFEQTMNSANDRLDVIAEATGVDLNAGNGMSQSGKPGGFAAMTQDQGTKLEGMFTSGLQHWSSMDALMEQVSVKMSGAESHLAQIAQNTGTSAGHLLEIKDDVKRMIRDGLKMQ